MSDPCCDCGGPIDRPGKPRCQSCLDEALARLGAIVGREVRKALGDEDMRVTVQGGGKRFDVTPASEVN